VLMNFCVNARDAMPQGGRLTIRAFPFFVDSRFAAKHPGAATGPHVVVDVSDTGCGISKSLLHRVFEPFFTTKPMGEGTGLGLSTSLSIVQRHGGFIDVQSEVGVGTTFRIYLPAEPDLAAEPEVFTTNGRSAPSGGGELILLVDDEEPILTVGRHTLEAYGYRVITAID